MNSLTKDQAGSIFDKVVETCEKKLYDPKLNGVDWRRIAETRKERILAAADEAEFEREFNNLIRELRVSHAGFYHERRPRAAPARAVRGGLPIYQADRDAIANAHGHALRTVNGRVIAVEGNAPAKVAIVEWDSADEAVAFYKSEAWKKLTPEREKTQKTLRRYVVEAEP